MPIGIFCWMCVEAIKMKSPQNVLVQFGWFCGTAAVAFFIHLFLVHPGIYFLILRKNPFKFYANIVPAIMVAIGSCSRFQNYLCYAFKFNSFI
jgi:Na+/H+-dicarboxylate symporter